MAFPIGDVEERFVTVALSIRDVEVSFVVVMATVCPSDVVVASMNSVVGVALNTTEVKFKVSVTAVVTGSSVEL